MKINIKTFLLCPIPEDQKPMNDYLKLKEKKGIIQKNYFLISLFCFLFYKFIILLENENQLFFAKIQIIYLISFSIFTISYLQKLIQCFNLKKALSCSRFFYEEGSWYDGAIWEKPIIIIKNDKLLETQKVNLFLRYLYRSIIKDFTLFLITSLLLMI